MKKVGISTVHTGFNYGSALQAFASKTVLNELGYQGINISLKGSLVQGRDVRIKKIAVMALRLLRQPRAIRKRFNVYSDNLSTSYSEKSKDLFIYFKNHQIIPQTYNWIELKRAAYSNEFTAFLCGSDQIWNGEALYVDPLYYLRFAPKHKRIAFAPSFGREMVADYNKRVITKYINDIPNLSVREESGLRIIKELTGKEAIQLIDPTLILTATQWDQCLGIHDTKSETENYILSYFLNEPTEYAKTFIEKLSTKNKLKVILLPYARKKENWFDETPDAGPIEFVSYVKNATYVCTDSFHGTAFAVNYNVPFFTFDRQYGDAGKQSSRIVSFLNLVSLEERFNPLIDMVDNPIHFNNSNRTLELERKRSINYLLNSLQNMEEK